MEQPSSGSVRRPEGRILGVGLGLDEKKLLAKICEDHEVPVHQTDDVRELMSMLVNVLCGGIAMGDQTFCGSAKAYEVNLATLKRLRNHARGREVPVIYLVHWPDRDHVMRLAQLGIRDVVGLPAGPEYVEERLTQFVSDSKETWAAKGMAS